MSTESFISFFDQFAIKPLFAAARFVSGDKQNGFALGIERERNAPNAVGGGKAKLFHIRMTGSIKCVDMRALQLRPKLL